jgi:predicted glycosyltransferase
MALFTGPYLPDTALADLTSAAGPGVVIRRFSTRFTAWLSAADLSVSMAGYNTCMNLLTAGVPALVWPFDGDHEQPLRAARLEQAGWLSVLHTTDLAADRLAARIEEALEGWVGPNSPVDLQGALKTGRYIESQHQPRKRPPREKRPMKILVYCQQVLGIGHLFRTLEICRAMDGHDVILVSGGQETPVSLPVNVRHRKLPELTTDRDFHNLHSPRGASLEAIRAERRDYLRAIYREETPDVFLIELYPIGRKAFRFEIDPLLEEIADGRLPDCKVVCSVRDILVEKEDTLRHETRAVKVLNRWFDALLVHADPSVVRLEETFGQMGALRIPVSYTGFVAAKAEAIPDRNGWRRSRGIGDDQRLVVASAGGGAVGFDLLKAVARAVEILQARQPLILQAFTGPFMAERQVEELKRLANAAVRFERFSPDFGAWLKASDASVSMAGYNTCMNILATRARAIVYPFAQNREQGLRAQRLAAIGCLNTLGVEDLEPKRLARRIEETFERAPSPDTVNLDGAVRTAEWLEGLMASEGSPG